jgi:hypothetical protein
MQYFTQIFCNMSDPQFSYSIVLLSNVCFACVRVRARARARACMRRHKKHTRVSMQVRVIKMNRNGPRYIMKLFYCKYLM